jgi:hypothetical protein
MATISETSGVGNMPLSSIPLEILWANNHQFRTKGAIFIHAQRHLAGKNNFFLLHMLHFVTNLETYDVKNNFTFLQASQL